MKPQNFEYLRPESVDDAVAALAEHEDAKVLAGGQSLVPLLNFRLAAPAVLVDVNRIPALEGITLDEGRLRMGATTRTRALELDPAVRQKLPILAAAARWVGHVQIRNRGTLGGTIAHADPAAELPAICQLLGGTVEVESARGSRRIDAADLFLGFMTTAIDDDELITSVSIPILESGDRWAFEEYARRHGDFALAGSGVVGRMRDDGAIESPRIVVFGTPDRPVRAGRAEAVLDGQQPTRAEIENASLLAADEALADDPRPDAAYRRTLTQTMVQRALATAFLGHGRGALV